MKFLRHCGLNFVQRIAIILATDSLKSFIFLPKIISRCSCQLPLHMAVCLHSGHHSVDRS